MSLKKILTIFLAALMLSSIVLTANAENTDIFKVGVEASSPTPVSSLPEIYNKGDEITVKLRANQNTGITSVKLLIDYDETLLEVVEGRYKATNLFTESDKLTSVVSTNGNGYFVFVSDNYPQVSEREGVFAEITFLVKNVCSDETAIEVSVFGNEKNCVKNTLSGVKVVPYEFERSSFSIHGIDKSKGIVTEPTCTEDGYTTYQCDDCKKSVVGNISPAKSHTESEPVVENTVAPTCTKEGSYDSVVYCADCHTELSRENFVINALEHKYGETTVIEPEYKQEGYSTHTCTVCGYEEKFDFKPALTYILGDVNGDETINDADAVYLLMHTFFPDEYPVNQVGDFDGDGAVTDADAVYILMYTFFPEDYPIA